MSTQRIHYEHHKNIIYTISIAKRRYLKDAKIRKTEKDEVTFCERVRIHGEFHGQYYMNPAYEPGTVTFIT